MSYCFMRVEKIKTETSFANKYAHNFREANVPNADPNKSNLNEELIAMNKDKDYYSAFQRRVKESPEYAGKRLRKDAVKGIEVMLTYNSRTVGPEFDERKWKEENAKWLQDTFGKENVISAVLHKDEATPHIHAIVIPMVDGRLNSRHYLGGKAALSNLQTSYGKYMKSLGLERGLEFSKAEHTDINRYYAALNKTLSKELPYPEKGETAHEYRDRVNEIYVDANLKHLGDMYDMDRKRVESKTMDINDKFELESLRKIKSVSERTRIQALRFEEILKGLNHGYFATKEENEKFKQMMKDISQWERDYEKERPEEFRGGTGEGQGGNR